MWFTWTSTLGRHQHQTDRHAGGDLVRAGGDEGPEPHPRQGGHPGGDQHRYPNGRRLNVDRPQLPEDENGNERHHHHPPEQELPTQRGSLDEFLVHAHRQNATRCPTNWRPPLAHPPRGGSMTDHGGSVPPRSTDNRLEDSGRPAHLRTRIRAPDRRPDRSRQIGADDGIRTRDPNLGKVMLYH